MQEFFTQFGLDTFTFKFIVLPALIFISRVADVSLSTLRIVFVMNGKRFWAPFLGFFEAFIWLLAIGQIFQSVDNIVSYIAYAGGYAMGTYIGMRIEEKLAVGNVVIRVITQKPASEVLDYLHAMKFRFSCLPAEDQNGEEASLLFAVIKRKRLEEFLGILKTVHPKAYFTVEGVKKMSEEEKVVAPKKKMLEKFMNRART